MEHIIEKLLRDFEQGKMGRRQLIQSLALAATAASAVGAAPAAVAAGTGFNAVSVNHISFDVADYTKVRDFYVDLFGMKVWGEDVKQDRPAQAHLRFGGDTYLTIRNRPSNTPRVEHIAIAIEKFDKKVVEAELKRRGMPANWDSGGTVNIKDPEGFHVQIVPKNFTVA